MERYLLPVILSLCVLQVWGHGRLIDPPSRASMWRFGFNTPPDYQDTEGFCGGFTKQWYVNRGQCGICGDNFADPQPREHELGGKYGLGVITRIYTAGQVIQAQVDITANHLGYFMFRLCPASKDREVTQDCLDSHLLPMADGSGFQHFINSSVMVFPVALRLPDNLTCDRCVLQWTYTAGNNWGICDGGEGEIGCGPQETFRACADITILPDTEHNHSGGEITPPVTVDLPSNVSSKPHIQTTVLATVSPHSINKTTAQGTSSTHASPTSMSSESNSTNKKCSAIGVWQNDSNMNSWCDFNCNHVVSFCPENYCHCG